MIGGGDGDRVEVRRGEELANVGEFFYRDALFGEIGGGAIEYGGVAIANRDDADAFDFTEAAQVVFAAAVESDDRDTDVGIRTHHLAPRASGEGGGGGEERGVAQKTAARERGCGHGVRGFWGGGAGDLTAQKIIFLVRKPRSGRRLWRPVRRPGENKNGNVG